MFLHQIIMLGVFGLNGFEPWSFSVQDDEVYDIHRVRYTEYWRGGMVRYICDVTRKGDEEECLFSMAVIYDSSRERWYIITKSALADNDVLISSD